MCLMAALSVTETGHGRKTTGQKTDQRGHESPESQLMTQMGQGNPEPYFIVFNLIMKEYGVVEI